VVLPAPRLQQQRRRRRLALLPLKSRLKARLLLTVRKRERERERTNTKEVLMMVVVPPALEDFDAEVTRYHALLDKLQSTPAPVNFTWLRVQAKPVIRVRPSPYLCGLFHPYCG
jgi:hypothetical protein